MPQVEGRTLDRIPFFDERSRNYPIRELLRSAPNKVRSYTWRCNTYLDQGSEGACVGFGITHEAAARPVERAVTTSDAQTVYRQAQKVDEWPGEAYSGTSVLAGMKIATSMGWFTEYRWAFGLEDLVMAVGYRGPVVIGVNWYHGMFNVDDKGFLRVTGNLGGGHCVLVRGVTCRFLPGRTSRTFSDLDLDASSALIHNSWGQDWGRGGTARITLRDLDRLLREQGDACIPVVRKK